MKGDVVTIKVQPGDMVVEGQVSYIRIRTRAVDPDPHSFSLLDPDPGVNNFQLITGQIKGNYQICNICKFIVC